MKPKQAKPESESSSSGSSDSDDSGLEVEMSEPSPIPPERPQEPEGAIRYDTLKAVWFPRNGRPAGSAVKNAMILFSDTIKGVRDAWKTRSEALKVAENQNQEDKIPSIKKDVIFQRRLIDVIINTTLEYGHPAFVARYVLFLFTAFILTQPCQNTYKRLKRWRYIFYNHDSMEKPILQQNKCYKQEQSRLNLKSIGSKTERGRCGKLKRLICLRTIMCGHHWYNTVGHEIHTICSLGEISEHPQLYLMRFSCTFKIYSCLVQPADNVSQIW
jgi:hypothetical protein